MPNDNGAKKAVFAHMRVLELKSGDAFPTTPLQTRLIGDGFISDDFASAIDSLSEEGLIKGSHSDAKLYLTHQGFQKLRR